MIKKTNSYPPIADQIISELYRSVELLGADQELLALIGSWNETLPDELVLEGLQFWIKCKLAEQQPQKPSPGQTGANPFFMPLQKIHHNEQS